MFMFIANSYHFNTINFFYAVFLGEGILIAIWDILHFLLSGNLYQVCLVLYQITHKRAK